MLCKTLNLEKIMFYCLSSQLCTSTIDMNYLRYVQKELSISINVDVLLQNVAQTSCISITNVIVHYILLIWNRHIIYIT